MEIECVIREGFKMVVVRKGKVIFVDKVNVFELSRLWCDVVEDVVKDFFDVKLEYMFVDNVVM